MASVSFGRYTSYNSFTHKLDPRNKLLLLILLMVAIFLPFTLWSTRLIMSGVYLILLITLMIISRVSFLDLFKSMKAMWILIIFLFIIYIFVPNSTYSDRTFSFFGWFDIHWDAIYQSSYIILRLILMISLTMILTSTTKPMDLTYGFEWYMTPLKPIHFPVHEIAMTLSIALRFIPTLLDETDRIMKAQASRGVDFEHGRLAKRFKAIISLIVPLFISAIERSEELSNAMEARGYDPKAKRTKYRKLKFSWRDIIAFIIGAGIFAGVVVLVVLDTKDNPIDLINFFFGVEVGF